MCLWKTAIRPSDLVPPTCGLNINFAMADSSFPLSPGTQACFTHLSNTLFFSCSLEPDQEASNTHNTSKFSKCPPFLQKVLIFNNYILPAHVLKLTWSMNIIANMLMLRKGAVISATVGYAVQLMRVSKGRACEADGGAMKTEVVWIEQGAINGDINSQGVPTAANINSGSRTDAVSSRSTRQEAHTCRHLLSCNNLQHHLFTSTLLSKLC